MSVRWVRQEDAYGCGLAVLAMLTGRTYAEAKERVRTFQNEPCNWAANGCTHYTLDRFLAGDGWYVQRRYNAWTELSSEPFADIHYASVQQPSNNGHFVVVLGDGTVLDPNREGRYRLSDWAHVNQIVGLIPPASPNERKKR